MNELKDIEAWLQAEIAPQAEEIDQNPEKLFKAFQQLGDRDLLALRLPLGDGGRAWTQEQESQFQILLSSYSGALAFLATQHQSASRMIAACDNPSLKNKCLSNLISARMGCGVGFSHLRRQGEPMVTAAPTQHGFALTGTVPWVTGYQCFDGFICGAVLPDGRFVMGWVPLTHDLAQGLSISEPLDLAAMGVTQTVALKLSHYSLSHEDVLAVHPPNWLKEKDRVNTLHHGFYALGAARGALRLMNQWQEQFQPEPVILNAIASFQDEYDQCEARMLALLPLRQSLPEECLQAKARVNSLAGRLAQAAVALVGGGANSMQNSAQRIYREVLAFTVFGQTHDAKLATLAALSASASSQVSSHPSPAQGVEV